MSIFYTSVASRIPILSVLHIQSIMCGCEFNYKNHRWSSELTRMHVYIYMYIYICVCPYASQQCKRCKEAIPKNAFDDHVKKNACRGGILCSVQLSFRFDSVDLCTHVSLTKYKRMVWVDLILLNSCSCS